MRSASSLGGGSRKTSMTSASLKNASSFSGLLSNSSSSNSNNTNISHPTVSQPQHRHTSQGGHNSIHNVMNAAVSSKDSLYYICLNVKKRLEKVPQLQPYLNLAYSSSELLSERQSLLLSQRQQQNQQRYQQLNNNNKDDDSHHSNGSSTNISGTTTTPTPMSLRTSTMSTNSMKDDFSFDSNYTSTTASNGYENTNSSMEDTLLTYSMGILPISMDCDPVTQLSQLFQQGSPLCIIFNLVKPQFKLPIVSSDDLKICKKSIYDFILGCKQHFAFNDEELFTISDVFVNSTNQLIKVIDVVITIMDSASDIFPSSESIQKLIDEDINSNFNKNIKKYNDYFKIFKEFVYTERKYVHDLEILEKYKYQLLNSNIITSEEIYMLFPNLSDAIDFQRRFLISLEINSLVEPNKQRIGALFMHSKWFFKLYEPWSIGQNAAIDFLTSTLEKLNSSSNGDFVIKNKLELQSFLYKPVQRLCRYPLLLKELASSNSDKSSDNNNTNSSDGTNMEYFDDNEGNKTKLKELDIALEISKNIARSINENQRRTENHQVVKKLYGRVLNWKGYRISKFGELLYFDTVFISTNNSNDQEREFEVYLFEKIIILFQQIIPKKSSSSILKKKSISSTSSSSSTLNLSSHNHMHSNNISNHNNNNSSSNSSNNNSVINLNNHSSTSSLPSYPLGNEPKLDLRGRIMIMNLNQISPISNRSLSITWESIKEQGNFILKFKNEEIRDNWSSCLQSLIRNIKSESYKSNASETSFISSSSMALNRSSSTGTNHHNQNHDSVSSFGSGAIKHISEMLPKQQKKRISNFDNEHRVISENYMHTIPESSIMIRVSFNSDFYTLLVEMNSSIETINEVIQKKLDHMGKFSKMKYQDEDGDFVVLESEDDWLVVKNMLKENNEKLLNVTVYP